MRFKISEYIIISPSFQKKNEKVNNKNHSSECVNLNFRSLWKHFLLFLVFHYLGQLAIKQHLIIHKRENSGERIWVMILLELVWGQKLFVLDTFNLICFPPVNFVPLFSPTVFLSWLFFFFLRYGRHFLIFYSLSLSFLLKVLLLLRCKQLPCRKTKRKLFSSRNNYPNLAKKIFFFFTAM